VKRYLAIGFSLIMASPAVAGGSIGLNEVVSQLAGQSTELMKEISKSLAASNKRISELDCVGLRLGRHWEHLGATRIPPFSCEIGGKVLSIKGSVSFYDDTGQDTGADPKSSMYYAMSDITWEWQ